MIFAINTYDGNKCIFQAKLKSMGYHTSASDNAGIPVLFAHIDTFVIEDQEAWHQFKIDRLYRDGTADKNKEIWFEMDTKNYDAKYCWHVMMTPYHTGNHQVLL